MPKFSDEVLSDIFTYHAPTPDQIPKYAAIRESALAFVKVLRDNTPESPDQTVAIRNIREAVMWANSSIANNGKY